MAARPPPLQQPPGGTMSERHVGVHEPTSPGVRGWLSRGLRGTRGLNAAALRADNEKLKEELRALNPGFRGELLSGGKVGGAEHPGVMPLRRERRAAMVDVIDTLKERMYCAVHDSGGLCAAMTALNQLEARAKEVFQGHSSWWIGAAGCDVGWGKRWRAVGQDMPVHDAAGSGGWFTKSRGQSRGSSPAPSRRPTLGGIAAKAGNVGRTMKVAFGAPMRQLYFSLPKGYLDGVGCGATPLPVQQGRELWDGMNQRNPVLWRFKMPFVLQQAETRLAGLLHADPDDTTLVMNARFAVSCVLRGLPWLPGDRVLLLSTSSAPSRDACDWLRRR
eukprot:gene53177-233_t